ncbi:uncharacterized protein LOC119495270 isoform X1 [Tachysurus ichikawai]
MQSLNHPCCQTDKTLMCCLLLKKINPWLQPPPLLSCLHRHNSSTCGTDSFFTSPGYVSPTEILPFPKSQQPRAKTKRKRVKTRILTDTPENQAIEMEHKKRKNKLKGKQVTSIKEQGKSKKKQTKKKTLMYSSSEESDVPIPLDDTSECEDESSEPDISDLSDGDFIIVNFATKCSSYHYIGLVESLEGIKVNARFLRQIRGSFGKDKATFAFKENDVQ